MLRGYAREEIMQIMKKTMVEFISVLPSIYYCLLFLDLATGDVRWCLSLAVGSLFKITSDPQFVAVSFSC